MLLRLAYGEEEKCLDLTGLEIKKMLEPKPFTPSVSEESLVSAALQRPIASPPLGDLVRKGESACIIVGDVTRLAARYDLLTAPIIDELNRGGIEDDNITIISATGDHREQTPAEHRLIVGREAYRRCRVYDHRAHRRDELSYLGTTSFGTPVAINNMVLQADRVILTGGIVYHFLAGWGGGKKAIIPGVSGYDTIMKNHSLAFYPEPGRGLNPAVCAGKLAGNPCNEDMLEGAAMVKPDFLVNTIIDEDRHRIACVVAGDYLAAHEEGCAIVNDHFGITLEEKADLIIASCGGYPKDINLYQTYKTIYNAHFALKKGGTLLLLSECREKMGSDDFAQILTAYDNNESREAILRESYSIGRQMGYHTAVLAEEYDILLYSALSAEELSKTGMIACADLESGLDFIREKHKKWPTSYVMPYGGSTLPFIAHGDE